MDTEFRGIAGAYEGRELLGRDPELNELDRLWRLAKSGNPQWVTIIGETGTGKTRLVQEFFRHLSRNDDLGNYWPDGLPINGQLLGLNPHPQAFTQDSGKQSSPLPWLWWGIRCADPGRRNAGEVSCAFSDALEPFSIHIDPLLRLRQVRDVSIDATKEIAKNLLSIASGGFADPLLAIFGLLGKASNVIKANSSQQTVQEVALAKSQSMTTLIVDSIFRYLDMQIPVILVLDDCQWIDQESVAIVTSIANRLGSQKLKLMIVATSWKREYEDVKLNRLHRLLAKDLASAKPLVGSFLGDTHEIRLGGLNERDAGTLMRRLLPGLSESDIATIHARTGGNVRHIYEICNYLVRWSRNFEQQDPANRLSASARKDLQSKETELDDLIDLRFSTLDSSVQRVLQISSFQGARFDVAATEDVANVLMQSFPTYLAEPTQDLITIAERPGSMIYTSAPGIREFLPGPYWRVARKNLEATDEDTVAHSYSRILPTLLGRGISSLNGVQVGLISSLANTCSDGALVRQCRVTLTQVFYRSQRYEMALEQIARIAQVDPRELLECGSDFAECALEVISYFGVRLSSEQAGVSADAGIWSALLNSVIYEEVRKTDLETSGNDVLQKQIRQLALIARVRDVLGEMLDAMQEYRQLADRICKVAAARSHAMDEAVMIDFINHLATALERCGPYSAQSPRLVGNFREWISTAAELLEGVTSEVVRRLLRGRIGVVELQMFEALHDGNNYQSEVNRKFTQSANDIGEVLSSRYDFHASEGDVQALSTPSAQFALAASTCRVIEQALDKRLNLAHVFVDRHRRMISSITKDAEEGKYLSPQLATALVDSALAASIFLRRELDRLPSSPALPEGISAMFKVVVLPERTIDATEPLEWSRFGLQLADHYYESNKGSVEFLVARARTFVLALEMDDELRDSQAETYFAAVLDDAIASEDGKREIFCEPPQLKEWLTKLRDNWLSGDSKKEATLAIKKLYGDE